MERERGREGLGCRVQGVDITGSTLSVSSPVDDTDEAALPHFCSEELVRPHLCSGDGFRSGELERPGCLFAKHKIDRQIWFGGDASSLPMMKPIPVSGLL